MRRAAAGAWEALKAVVILAALTVARRQRPAVRSPRRGRKPARRHPERVPRLRLRKRRDFADWKRECWPHAQYLADEFWGGRP